MTRLILKAALPIVILASGLCASAERLPDPFTPYPVSQRIIHGFAPVAAARALEARHNGFPLFGLFSVAILCLVVLEVQIKRRVSSKEERMALALAGALRSGSLEFTAAPRASNRNLFSWPEPDEPEPVDPESMPSRYTLIAYDQPAIEPPLTCVTRLFGPGITDEDKDLLQGVPVSLLRPEVAYGAAEAEPALAE